MIFPENRCTLFGIMLYIPAEEVTRVLIAVG
jgi:hypothetical protein